MVDNFALFVSQLMMIVVLWRAFTLPDADASRDDEPKRFNARARRNKGK